MRFPYIAIGPDIHRPIIAFRVWGPDRYLLVDGLLDTGADRTLLTPKLAQSIGIDLDKLADSVIVRSATGQPVVCKTTIVMLQVVRDAEEITWRAEIAIPLDPIHVNHLGFKGFLEYFASTFDGPNRHVTLIAGSNLPVTAPPYN